MRTFQDPKGEETENLNRAGITAFWSEESLTGEQSKAGDELARAFVDSWFFVDGADISLCDGISLGRVFSYTLKKDANPFLFVRHGEIFRKLIDMYPDASEIVSDFEDGIPDYTQSSGYPFYRKLMTEISRQHGITLRLISSPAPMPSILTQTTLKHGWFSVLRQYIGGFRPAFLKSRFRLWKSSKTLSRAFVFTGHAMSMLTRELLDGGKFRVFSDQPQVEGVELIRLDHFFAFPPIGMWQVARRMLRHAKHITRGGEKGRYVLNGFDYGPIWGLALERMIRRELYPQLIHVCQTKKFLSSLRPDVVVINGESAPIIQSVIWYAPKFGIRVVYVSHGLNLYAMKMFSVGRNVEHVLYISYGEDHLDEYGTHLPDGRKPPMKLIGSPQTSVMNAVVGRHSHVGRKQILFLNFGNNTVSNSIRSKNFDKYIIDLMTAARVLAERGYSFLLRYHPGGNRDYYQFIIREFDCQDFVKIDDSKTLADALLKARAVISNVSSCLYQCLYAGWPTVFFEPDYDPSLFVGLPAAPETGFPIAQTADELVAKIEECCRPDSSAARFPHEFRTTLAHRYIGPCADRAHSEIAAYLSDNFLSAR